MVKNIGVGSENGKYYVQLCCGEEHNGEQCNCEAVIEEVPKELALEIAVMQSQKLNVPVHKWY